MQRKRTEVLLKCSAPTLCAWTVIAERYRAFLWALYALIVLAPCRFAAAQHTFFDDFSYNSVSGPSNALLGSNPWTGRASQFRAWWADRDDYSVWLSVVGDEHGFATITRPAHQALSAIGFNTAIRFRQGTYATCIRFVHGAPEATFDIIQYFCPISAHNFDPYSEYDFEYLPRGSWWCGTDPPAGTATMYMVTWPNENPQEPYLQNCQSVQAALIDDWYVLIVRAQQTGVIYEIRSASGQLVFGPSSPLLSPYTPDAYMELAYGIWEGGAVGGEATDRTYGLDVDWVYFSDASLSPTYADIMNAVNAWRLAGITRVDNPEDDLAPVVYDFLFDGGSPSIIAGIVELCANAQDNVWPHRIEFSFSLDGVNWTSLNSLRVPGQCCSWRAVWDTTPIEYEAVAWVRAIAFDGAGNESLPSLRTVTVDNRTAGVWASPASLDFGQVSPDRTVTRNLALTAGGGAVPVSWQLSESLAWLAIAPPLSGALAPGESTSRAVQIDTTGLSSGPRSGNILLTYGSGQQQQIPVYLEVTGQTDWVPDQDIYVAYNLQNGTCSTSGGNDPYLMVGDNSSQTWRWWSFAHFNTNAINGKYIIGAWLHIYNDNPDTALMYAVLSEVLQPWNEGSTCQWLAQANMLDLLVNTEVPVQGRGWYHFGMTTESQLPIRDLVQYWADYPSENYGIAITQDVPDQPRNKYFFSSEAASNQVHLDIAYANAQDELGPAIAITSHQNGQHVTTASITLSGTAYDVSGINWVRVNGSTATGTVSWTKNVALQPHANTILVTAQDDSYNHNESSESITITPGSKQLTMPGFHSAA